MTITPYIIQNHRQTPALSDVAEVIKKEWQKSYNSFVGKSILYCNYHLSILKQEFDEYNNIWQDETMFLSNSDRITNHWAYHAIIDMGMEVLPFILDDMAETNNHWFEALEAITGQSPVPKEHWGNIPLMVSDWLTWAKYNSEDR